MVAAAVLRAQTSRSAPRGLTPQERRGKQIYLQGTTASGREILAYIGESSLEVPGSAMPCSGCHGLEGIGKPEGGVTPSNLTWEMLTKPYGVTHAGGRSHPPYTDRGLELAIVRGLDPGGNKLLNVMPRYQMGRDDMADLIAYLKLLGKDVDPGISDNQIVIGTAVPNRPEFLATRNAITAVLTAVFAEVNRNGGIYNRQISFKIAETGDNPEATAANLRRFIADDQIFAMAGVFMAGADRETAALMDEMEVPLVGPLTLYPQIGHPLNRHVFYVLSGMDELARALANFAAQRMAERKDAGALIVYPPTETAKLAVQSIKDQFSRSGIRVETFAYPEAGADLTRFITTLRQTGFGDIFFLGSGADEVALMKEADKIGWQPALYHPGALAGNEIFEAPATFNQKMFFSLPTVPGDLTQEGANEFGALAAKYNLSTTHVATQLSVYTAAKILIEGLKRAGKDLSREKLIQSLEGLYEYPTGLTPAITFGPNRRIGSMGAYIVTVDLEKKQFQPTNVWIKLSRMTPDNQESIDRRGIDGE